MSITILTPTYNRGYSLPRLYQSLVNQTNTDFTWLIVDDGSMDETKSIVAKFINEEKIKIKYIYKNNGGKHTALNLGIKNINTCLTFIVDSDDWLTEDAIDTIYNFYEKYKNYKELCGFSFLRQYPEGSINGPKFPKNELIESYVDCRLNRNISGDKAEVYYNEALKEFPFLEIEGEKFLSEDYVWVKMSSKYKTVHINKAIYIGDYLEDGLTKNIFDRKINSPIGMIERSKVILNSKSNLINKVKHMILYTVYSDLLNIAIHSKFKDINNKVLFIACYPLSIIYKLKFKYKMKGELNEC